MAKKSLNKIATMISAIEKQSQKDKSDEVKILRLIAGLSYEDLFLLDEMIQEKLKNS